MKFSPLFTRLPPEWFFWAVLDAPGLPKLGQLPESLLPELAEELPVPVDDLFAVATPTSDGRLLVCAVRRIVLESVSPSTQRLYPDSVPASLGVSAEAANLNFLVGEYEPKPVRSARVRRHAGRAALLVMAAALTTIGLTRRAAQQHATATAARDAATDLARELAPAQSPETALFAIDHEIARLTRSAQAAGAMAPPADASVCLAEVLSAWPANVPSHPQSLSVTPPGIMASVSLEGDAAAFLKAVRPPSGFTLEEPRVNSAAGITRISLVMRPLAPVGRTPEQEMRR